MPDDPDSVVACSTPYVPAGELQPSSAHPPGWYCMSPSDTVTCRFTFHAVGDVSLGDRDLIEALALAERDVAIGAAEVAVEREHDLLGDDEAAVAGTWTATSAGGRENDLAAAFPASASAAQRGATR